MLKADVTTDVRLQFLNYFFIDGGWAPSHSRSFLLDATPAVFLTRVRHHRRINVVRRLLVLDHVYQRVLHALQDQIVGGHRNSGQRHLCILTFSHRAGGLIVIFLARLLLVILFKILYLQIHYDFNTAADILQNLKAMALFEEFLLLLLQMLLVYLI